MVKDTPENRKKCICPQCPTFPRDCEDERLYCSLGKSRCDINAKGCICYACPVYSENKLKGLYFCDKAEVGTERIIMRKRKSQEDGSFYGSIVDIKDIAQSGRSVMMSMGSRKKMPFDFDDLHFVPAQLHRIPLNAEQKVATEVIVGPNSRRPLAVSSPVMITGMSFGAVSKNVRTVISRAATNLKIAFNSGEGGVMEEELEAGSGFMVGQYATGRFGINEDVLKKVAAVEIRFGQGAYPGKGSFLPAKKITPEIAEARGLEKGQPSYSPAHHPDILNAEDLKNKVSYLRELTGGVPIGAKIGCGNIEKDIEVLISARVDFIALDGFGGGTGATDRYARENVGLPIIAALPRAARFLEKSGARKKVTLIAGGGLRSSADFAKCLALGADAVYIGTAALIAINCEQYRICQTGLCPTGVTTHNPVLTAQIEIDRSISKLSNFIKVSTEEIANLARIVGKDKVSDLDKDDLVSMKKDLAELAQVKWLDGK